MTFLEAQREYDARLCLWAKLEWGREIEESFPNLRLFKTGWPWWVFQFLQQIKKSEQLALANALAEKRFLSAVDESRSTENELLHSRLAAFFRVRRLLWSLQRLEKEKEFTQARMLFRMMLPDVIKVVGGDFEKDEILRSRLEAIFQSIPTDFEDEIAARSLTGEKIDFVNKRTLRKAIKAKYMCAFGDQSAEPIDTVAGEPDLLFKTQCCGWNVITNFFFKGREGSIEYYHYIQSKDTFERLSQDGKYWAFLTIEHQISFCSWMGIGGTEWRYLTENEVEPACEGVIEFCQRFFEVAPKLLKGLEIENITAE